LALRVGRSLPVAYLYSFCLFHMDLRFSGKVVLITGAAGDIGRDTALAFLKHGANVVLHYHKSKESLEPILNEYVTIL
jgi:NADP-dependent 3-hydroxy acid dehydrogenase YdfG